MVMPPLLRQPSTVFQFEIYASLRRRTRQSDLLAVSTPDSRFLAVQERSGVDGARVPAGC